MLALKQDIEEHFNNTWTDTKVHFLGYKFDSTGLDNWIKVNVTPVTNDILDVTERTHEEVALIEVFCYGRTLHQATQTADNVESFIRDSTTYSVKATTSYDQNELDGKLWYQTVRINAFSRLDLIVSSYLIDGAGNQLVDSSLNKLIG